MVKFRIYFDKDEEEIWLNEMVAQGYAMKKFFLGFYRFVPCEKGAYIYQIDLFTENKRNMTHQEYVNLIEETGAEYICRWGWWRIFRRKTELGKFELYTDASSKLEQFQRIFRFFRAVAILESVITVYELILTGINWYRWGSSVTLVVCCMICLLMTGVLWNASYRIWNKICKLKQEMV